MCRSAAAQHQLFLSPFSVWEVSRKAQEGGIAVNGTVPAWISGMLWTTDVTMADFTFDVAVDTSQLPPHFHKDPVDRALASTCRVHQLTLLTRDRTLLRLASEHVFLALPI